MKENIKTILFIASVALNVFFAATYFSYKLPLMAGVGQPVQMGPLFLQLELSPDQVARFEAERDAFHARLQDLGQSARSRQLELIDLLEAAPSDQQVIAAKRLEIQHLQGTIQEQVTAHLLRASSILPPEKRPRFFRLIKERVETTGHGCPPVMKPLGQNQPGRKKN